MCAHLWLWMCIDLTISVSSNQWYLKSKWSWNRLMNIGYLSKVVPFERVLQSSKSAHFQFFGYLCHVTLSCGTRRNLVWLSISTGFDTLTCLLGASMFHSEGCTRGDSNIICGTCVVGDINCYLTGYDHILDLCELDLYFNRHCVPFDVQFATHPLRWLCKATANRVWSFVINRGTYLPTLSFVQDKPQIPNLSSSTVLGCYCKPVYDSVPDNGV